MTVMSNQTRNSPFRRFWREEDGLATFEACIWTPFFFIFLMLVVDATMIFSNQGRVHRIVQDANRQFILGQIDTTDDLQTWLEAQLASQRVTPNATATATVDANDILVTTVTYPSADTDLTGATGLLSGLTMRVTNYTLTEFDS